MDGCMSFRTHSERVLQCFQVQDLLRILQDLFGIHKQAGSLILGKGRYIMRLTGLPVSPRDAPADRRCLVPVPGHRRGHPADHHAGGRDELPARKRRHLHRDPTADQEWAGIGRGDLDDVLPPHSLLFLATSGAGVVCRTRAGDRHPHYRGSL